MAQGAGVRGQKPSEGNVIYLSLQGCQALGFNPFHLCLSPRLPVLLVPVFPLPFSSSVFRKTQSILTVEKKTTLTPQSPRPCAP